MANLVALAPIKVGFREYQPGEQLPQDHPDAEAWVESGAAVLRGDDYTPPIWIKARRAAAEPGLPGIAVGPETTGEDLVGKIPDTGRRRRTWRG